MGEEESKGHKFWDGQPVVHENEKPATVGVISTDADVSKISTEPEKLMAENYTWCEVDIGDPKQMEELFNFLKNHYVSHSTNPFRFAYTAGSLEWALHPPGWKKEWLVGVRSPEGVLVAFISAVPITVYVEDKELNIAAVDFLSVHRQLRNKNLAPVLIKEVTRRVNLTGIFTAIYTVGRKITKPFTTAQYFHKLFSYEKLCEIGFTSPIPGSDMNTLIKRHAASRNSCNIPGLRKMEEKDVPEVTAKLNEYLNSFTVRQHFTEDEVKHYFLPIPDVVGSYVIEKKRKIEAFASFYIVPSSVENEKHDSYIQAYLFYYFSKSSTLADLIKAVAALSHFDYKADVFNCLNIMSNQKVLEQLNFLPGDGYLNYYFFNYQLPAIKPEQCGVALI